MAMTFWVKISRLLGIATAALALWLASSTPAAAQAHACPSPGANEQVVGMTPSGPLCVYIDNMAPAAPSAPPRVTNRYASIAWHPDVDQVWVFGNYDAPNGAAPRAMAACQQAMGDGCRSLGEWRNAWVAIARDWSGYLHSGDGANAAAARQSVLNSCRGDQPLPCEIIGSYGAGERLRRPDFAVARKLYGAGAWVEDRQAPAGMRAWIATGHASADDATGAAVAACQRANPGSTCAFWAVSGNGLIQTFTGDGNPHALPERNAKRAAEAMKARCAARGERRCVPQAAYDSRKSGLFVHDFAAGASK